MILPALILNQIANNSFTRDEEAVILIVNYIFYKTGREVKIDLIWDDEVISFRSDKEEEQFLIAVNHAKHFFE